MRRDASHHFKKPSLAEIADVHLKRSQINRLLARYDDAFTGLHRAMHLGEAGGDQGLAVTCRTREIYLCYLTGQLERGLALGEQVLRHPDIERYLTDKAQAYNSLGNIHLRRFDVGPAEESFETARSIYRQQGDELAEARVECNLANVRNVHGDNTKALELYQHARDIFQRHEDSYTTAHVTKAIGQVLMDMGDIEGARTNLGRALQLSVRMQDYRRQSSCLLDLADLDNASRRFDDALGDIERGRELAVAHGIKDPNHWACLYGKLAETFMHLGRWDEAIAALEQMLEISQAHRFLAFLAEGYNLLGLVMVKKTNDAGNIGIIERGIALASEHHLDYQEFSGRLKLAEACGWLGQRDRAIALFKECVPLARKMGSDTGPILGEIGKLETAREA